MANITLTSNLANITVTSTPSNISVTDTDTNVTISNIVTATTNVDVTSTQSNVIVSATAKADVVDVRTAISATTTPGGLATLSYNNTTGVINLSGPQDSDVRSVISGTSPIGFNQSTGVISIDSSAVFSGKTTDDLAEGSTNLYYTTDRANTAIGAYQGSIDTPGNISGNVFTGNTVIAGSSNITDMVGTNLTVTSATINGTLSIDALNTGNIVITETARPNITLKGTSGPHEANIFLQHNANTVVVDGSLALNDANDTIKSSKFSGLTNTSDVRIGSTDSAVNAYGNGDGIFSGTGNIDIRGDNRSVLGDDNANTNNFVRVFGGPSGNTDIVNNVAAAFNVLTAGSGTLDYILKANNNQIATYKPMVTGGDMIPKNTAGDDALQSGKSNTTGESWYKMIGLNHYASRLLLANSASLPSKMNMPGKGDKAAIFSFSGEFGPDRGSSGLSLPPYVQLSPTTDTLWDTDSGHIGGVSFNNFLVTTQNEYTGSKKLTGNIHTDGLLTSNANISTLGTFSAGSLIFGIPSQTHTFIGNVDVTGNVEVSGNLNYRNVEDLYVRDQTITLNANAITDATVEIIANRPQSTYNAVLRWNETDEKWSFMNGDNTFNDMLKKDDFSVSTAADAGGGALSYNATTGNFQFTPADLTNLIALTSLSTTTASPSANGSLAYDNTTGVFTFTPADVPDNTDELSEGSTNLYYTDSRFDTRLGTKSTSDLAEGTNLYYTDSRFDTRLGTKSTSDLAEGTNLYYTTARANTAIGAYTGSLTNLTGNITTTANISGNYILGNGSALTGIVADISSNTTDDLAEGSTNLYYTDARVEAYLSGNTSTINANTIQANAFIGGTFTGDGSDLTDVRAESMEVTLKNADTVTIPKGYPVHATGFSGSGEVEVVLADAGNAELMPAHFIAQEELTSVGDIGRGILGGRIQNVDTSSFTVGDTIFVAVGGGYANVAPSTEANLIQNLGIVTRIDASNGGGEIMGAGRTAATPNLDDGALFVGSSTNQAVAVNSTTNFDVSDTEFDLANALTNVNQITSEAGNDKFTFKALLGADNTSTNSGNITSDGYEVIINSDHTYDSAGNIAQSGTNNLNGYAVSGVFTAGSNVMTLTGVTELKNVYNSSGNIDGTNNNVSLTGDMVANMIPDQNYAAYASGGDQYPLPQGTRVASANTTAIVFTESALANVTAANATNDATQGPFSILHGGYDSSTGQILSFLSQDDAVADGTQVESIDSGANAGIIAFVETLETPVSPETNDSIVIGLPGTPSIPVGTAVAFANVTGTGASNINGQTLYIKRDVFGDNFNYTLTTDAAGTTTATMTAFGLVSFDTGGGDITYTVPQSTSTINKARLYVEDTYGYPATGPTANDFTYSIGSASDYTIDLSAATTSMRGRTSLEAPRQVLKAPIGLTIGENTTMSNRGDGDTFTNFGLNFMWDGLTNYGTEYAGTSSSIVPQMLFKNHTDNTFGATTGGKGKGGPRLFFSAATGNLNTDVFDKYPRKSQEIGRMMFWGTTQTGGDGMSTVNPAGYISATASEDWTASNRLEMSLAANGNGTNDADIFLNYRNGQVVLASGSNGSTNEAIHFAPALQGNQGNAAQTYATLGHTWANVNYANVSASTGSKFTVTQGGGGASTDGDLVISLDREYIAGTLRDVMATPSDGGFTTFSSSGITGLKQGNETDDTIVMQFADFGLPDIPVGTPVTFENVVGDGNTNLNGGTFYSGRSPDGAGLLTLWTSSDGTTTPAEGATIGLVDANAYSPSGTGDGNLIATITGTSAREWELALDQSSEDLKIYNNGVLHSTFKDTNSEFNTQNAVVTGTLTPAKTVLQQFNETVVNLGNQSGNIAALAGFNAANASIFTLTATSGITISQIPNADTGSSYTIKVIQDGTGSHALTSTFKFAGGDKTLSTAPASIDVINVVYDGTDYLATLSKAYA
jgi:cytoskeletal protein CcmA (bactofilin family)